MTDSKMFKFVEQNRKVQTVMLTNEGLVFHFAQESLGRAAHSLGREVPVVYYESGNHSLVIAVAPRAVVARIVGTHLNYKKTPFKYKLLTTHTRLGKLKK